MIRSAGREPSSGIPSVYALLLSYAWHNNMCFPGQDRLAEDMGLTRPRVTQLLNELHRGQLQSAAFELQEGNQYTLMFQGTTPRVTRSVELNSTYVDRLVGSVEVPLIAEAAAAVPKSGALCSVRKWSTRP